MSQTLERLLEYIRQRRAVSFDQLHEFMLSERLRFDPASNPVRVLYFEGAKNGRINVDYDQQMIYSRTAELSTATPWPSED